MDLCASLENPDFGKPTFMWADPKAPYMTGEGRNGVVTVEGAAYVATAIAAASRMPNPVRGTCRQIVLSKNFDDLYVIHDALPPELREKCVLRSRQMSLRKAVALWREREDAILLTCGAHEGLNEPGRVDHLILYRLPFDPPPEGEKKGSFATSVFDMLRTLRQAIGRGVRQASDNPVIWMLDVRVPPPEAVQARERAFFDKASARPSFLSAFPRRWKKAMDRGRILPCPDRLRRRPNAPPPTEEEI